MAGGVKCLTAYVAAHWSICDCSIRVYRIDLYNEGTVYPFLRDKRKLHQLPQYACCAIYYYSFCPATHTVLNGVLE